MILIIIWSRCLVQMWRSWCKVLVALFLFNFAELFWNDEGTNRTLWISLVLVPSRSWERNASRECSHNNRPLQNNGTSTLGMHKNSTVQHILKYSSELSFPEFTLHETWLGCSGAKANKCTQYIQSLFSVPRIYWQHPADFNFHKWFLIGCANMGWTKNAFVLSSSYGSLQETWGIQRGGQSLNSGFQCQRRVCFHLKSPTLLFQFLEVSFFPLRNQINLLFTANSTFRNRTWAGTVLENLKSRTTKANISRKFVLRWKYLHLVLHHLHVNPCPSRNCILIPHVNEMFRFHGKSTVNIKICWESQSLLMKTKTRGRQHRSENVVFSRTQGLPGSKWFAMRKSQETKLL